MEKQIYTIQVMNSKAKLEEVYATEANLEHTLEMLEEGGFSILVVSKRVGQGDLTSAPKGCAPQITICQVTNIQKFPLNFVGKNQQKNFAQMLVNVLLV